MGAGDTYIDAVRQPGPAAADRYTWDYEATPGTVVDESPVDVGDLALQGVNWHVRIVGTFSGSTDRIDLINRGDMLSAGDKRVWLTAAGVLQAQANGGGAISIGSGLRGSEVQLDIYYLSGTLHLHVDDVPVGTGFLAWAPDPAGTTTINGAINDADSADFAQWKYRSLS